MTTLLRRSAICSPGAESGGTKLMKASRHVAGRLHSLGAVVRGTGGPVWPGGITWFWPTAGGTLHGWAYPRQVPMGQLLAQLFGSPPPRPSSHCLEFPPASPRQPVQRPIGEIQT